MENEISEKEEIEEIDRLEKEIDLFFQVEEIAGTISAYRG